MKIIKLSKRLLSFILAIAIIASLLPMSMVFADTTDLDTTSPVLKVNNGTTNKPNPNAGDLVTITANSPPEGTVFNKWTSSDIEISSGNENKNSYTFTMPSKSVTLTANFKNSPDTESTVLDGLEALVSTSTTTSEKKIIPTFNLETKEHKLQLATTDYDTIYFILPKEKIDGRRITVALDGVEHVLTANNNQTSTFKITKAISEFAIRVTSKNSANTSTYKIIVKRGMAIPRALNVINGTTANTSPAVGDEITITADTPDVGKIFDKWISPDVSIQKPSISQTTFTMVDKDVTILATYKNDPEPNNTLEHINMEFWNQKAKRYDKFSLVPAFDPYINDYTLEIPIDYTSFSVGEGDHLRPYFFKTKTGQTARLYIDNVCDFVLNEQKNYNIEHRNVIPIRIEVSPQTDILRRIYNITINRTRTSEEYDGSPVISNDSPPNGMVGIPYSYKLNASGILPMDWKIYTGKLPEGLTLNGDTISGIPTKDIFETFEVTAKNRGKYGDKSGKSINIKPVPPLLTGNVTISGEEKYGEILTASVSDTNNTGELTYTWRQEGGAQGNPQPTYNVNKEWNIGKILYCEVKSDTIPGIIRSFTSGPILKADGPDAPTGLFPVYEWSEHSIEGTTEEMEYADNPAFIGAQDCWDWRTDISEHGTYYVRYKATETHNPSKYAGIILPKPYKAVTNITNVPSTGVKGTEVNLTTATVSPSDAINQTIVWSVKDAGTTGVTTANLETGKFTPATAGTLELTATITNGSTESTNYTKDFTIIVTAESTDIAVTGVTLDKSTLNLTVGGGAETLVATVAPANATNKSVTWSTSDAAVATVVNGVVTPVAAGSATITVTTVEGGFTATSVVTVIEGTVAVTGVTLDKSTLSLVAGGPVGTLVETVNPVNATNKAVTWLSSNPAVATVANGVVTPLTAGTTTITVKTVEGGFTATSVVTVIEGTVAVTGVTLDKSTLSLVAGGPVGTLVETVNPANATNKAVTWLSSNPAVATVANGVVTPLTAGTTTITVTTVDGGKTATSAVTVIEGTVAVTGVTLDKSTLNLTVGGGAETLVETVNPANATNKAVTWLSSNPAVATVANGVVTPLTAGTTTITVTTVDGGKTATSAVTVIEGTVAVTGVTLDKSTLNLTVGGGAETLVATVAPANATNKSVTWSTSDAAVATVVNGVVTPVAAGSATITVTTEDGNFTATSEVTATYKDISSETPDYKIIAGENGIWKKGNTKGIVIISNGDYGDFTGVNVDDIFIDPSNYTSAAGSTVVTLKPTYLETLAVGTHIVTLQFGNYSVQTNLTILAADERPDESKPDESKPDESKPDESKPDESKPDESKPDESKPDESKPDESKPDESKPDESKPNEESPKTGDSNHTLPLIGLLLLSGSALIGVTRNKKKKKSYNK